jgi:flagellar motor switch protein FliN/FliY
MPEDQTVDPASQSPPQEAGFTDSSTAPADSAAAPAGDSGDLLDAASIDELLKAANFEDPETVHASAASSGGGIAEPLPPTGDEFKLPNLSQVMQDAAVSSIELLRDVDLNVKIELGRARMLVEDVLKLAEGSVVELDKLAGDPVDVFVNDRLVARGEVLVLNDNFCVRVNEIIAGVKDEGQ